MDGHQHPLIKLKFYQAQPQLQHSWTELALSFPHPVPTHPTPPPQLVLIFFLLSEKNSPRIVFLKQGCTSQISQLFQLSQLSLVFLGWEKLKLMLTQST